MLHYYLTSGDRYTEIIDNERNLIESFVPVWLSSRLDPSIKSSVIAPHSNPRLVKTISEICNDLAACTWIMNGAKTTLSLEQIVRAVQQATLNVSASNRLYSAGATYAALESLTPLADKLAGTSFCINRVSQGELHRLEYGPEGSKPSADSEPALGTAEHGEMLELFLVDTIRRETGLEPRRYTLHDRAQFVIDWFCTFTSGHKSVDDLVQVLAGIASVFMPRVFLHSPVSTVHPPGILKENSMRSRLPDQPPCQ